MDFNVAFQADWLLFYCLKQETESLIKELSLNFLQLDYVESTSAFEIDVNNFKF